ncbi:flagellar export chaperone FliS [Vogesella oryzae]|uniref:flagellar export chaperone FliS n=1 Tax=Vogesella oryzae TaxID=1735285 RepID=UPI001581FCA5|nr:flagellar export chaperone FliS [Vogesella oryzae]
MNRQALKAYGQKSLELEVESASPHKLILLLFDGAIQAIKQARFHMENGNVAEKGRLISKAIAIVDEGLLLALDRNAGGELAENLAALYTYCCERLFMANTKNDVAALDEVANLLGEIKSAWEEIGKPQAGSSDGGKSGLNYGAV